MELKRGSTLLVTSDLPAQQIVKRRLISDGDALRQRTASPRRFHAGFAALAHPQGFYSQGS